MSNLFIQKKMKDVLSISGTQIIPSLLLSFLFGVGTVITSISLFFRILRSSNDGFMILLLDNLAFLIGLFIIAIPCVFFIKELVHDLRVSFVLNKALISQDGIHIKRKEEFIYKWEDIEAINGYHEGWRGDYIVILFNDGRNIEIPILHTVKDKTIQFLKEIRCKVSKKINMNKLSKKWLVSEISASFSD